LLAVGRRPNSRITFVTANTFGVIVAVTRAALAAVAGVPMTIEGRGP